MSLLNELIDYRNIHLAYERTKNGIINRELHNYYEQELFKKNIPNIYSNVQKELRNPNDYKFKPIEILKQPKKYINGAWEKRELARMEFFDQIIAQCVINIISKYIRTLLPIENYGYKLGKEKSNFMYEQWFRGYRKFVNKEIEAIDNEKYQYKYVCEADIKNFYPTISHEKLKAELYNYIGNIDDSEILEKWIEKILEIPLAYIKDGKIINKKSKGLPQGVIYSPILALFYIRDSFARIRGKFPDTLCFAYVDDFRFYCESKVDGENIKKEFIKYLGEKDLEVNKEKTYVKEIDKIKKEEVHIMGKASNLDRAIKNEILLSSDSRKKMKENLNQLFTELVKLENKENKEKLKSFRQRLQKFSDYRLIKLIDSTEEWNKVKIKWENHIINDDYETLFSSNFVANLHSLLLGAKTTKDKRSFLELLMKMYRSEKLEYLTYIKYILLQYIFNLSPYELRLTKNKREKILDLIEPINNVNLFYLKGFLSRIDNDWIDIIGDKFKNCKSDNRELNIILIELGLVKENNNMYNNLQSNIYKLEQSSNKLIYSSYSKIPKDYRHIIVEKQLKNEKFKNIYFKRFLYKNDTWKVVLESNQLSLTEYMSIINDSYEERFNVKNMKKLKILLRNIFKWLDIQFSYSSYIPISVVDPDYIWFDESFENITLYGNPMYKNNLLYYDKKQDYLWKITIVKLFETVFGLNLNNYKEKMETRPLLFWQYRIIQLLDGNMDLHQFLKQVLFILESSEGRTEIPINGEHLKIAHILKYYIPNPQIRDRVFEVSQYVEASWKSGSKECYFFTLHNQEHGRFLIYSIHNLLEETRYRLYINQKEALRLFSACYIHDLGMLSGPTDKDLYNSKTKNDLGNNIQEILSSMIEVAATQKDDINFDYNLLKSTYNIHYNVEQFREKFVRDNHSFLSKYELLINNYNLPLSVAERRDIGLICSLHNQKKEYVNKISDREFDNKSPIRIKLLAHLLRIADLFDVTKERISTEILERNYYRMSNTSLFHWLKHLSVDNIDISSNIENNTIKVYISIKHNYLPHTIFIDEKKLEKLCGNTCKKQCTIKINSEDKVELLMTPAHLEEQNGVIKYLDPTNCTIACKFINESYKWFFEEIIYFNEYINSNILNNTKVKYDLAIIMVNNNRPDFNYCNHPPLSTQDFMLNYLLGRREI